MRIRTVFLLGFLAVALPSLGATAWRAGEAWGAMRQAEQALLVTRDVATLQRARTGFSAQIGQLIAATRAPVPDLEDTRRTGEIAVRLLAEGAAAAFSAGLPATVPEEASRTAAALLHRVEAAAALPPGRRDPALLRDITTARIEFGDRLGQLAQAAARRLGPEAPQLAALLAGHAMAQHDAALDVARRACEARLVAGRWQIAGLLALLLGLLGLSSAAVTQLLRHQPVRARAGNRFAGGRPELALPRFGRRAERGEMAGAVGRLRAAPAEQRAQAA